MAYETLSGTISPEDNRYIRDLIQRGVFTGPTEIIREGIKCIRRDRGERS
jgi:Arc/MetJ-type ribon-helix-helix transcriptional regulator